MLPPTPGGTVPFQSRRKARIWPDAGFLMIAMGGVPDDVREDPGGRDGKWAEEARRRDEPSRVDRLTIGFIGMADLSGIVFMVESLLSLALREAQADRG